MLNWLWSDVRRYKGIKDLQLFSSAVLIISHSQFWIQFPLLSNDMCFLGSDRPCVLTRCTKHLESVDKQCSWKRLLKALLLSYAWLLYLPSSLLTSVVPLEKHWTNLADVSELELTDSIRRFYWYQYWNKINCIWLSMGLIFTSFCNLLTISENFDVQQKGNLI